jgi:hypothetical protein
VIEAEGLRFPRGREATSRNSGSLNGACQVLLKEKGRTATPYSPAARAAQAAALKLETPGFNGEAPNHEAGLRTHNLFEPAP